MTDDRAATSKLTTRRRVLALAGAAAAAPIGALSLIPTGARAQERMSSIGRASSPPNILFIFTDQERYRLNGPAGLSLPGHEQLQKSGVTFHNHYCPAVTCTSSRSVLLTGLQTPDNRMFENCEMPWIGALSPNIPTIGHMLRKAGYYTAYKGKWHLDKKFNQEYPQRLLTKEMEQYGFADFYSAGDVVGHTLGGYQFDHLIAGSAVTWLRRIARPLSDEKKPWCLFVSLVNPHDIMYFNTDLPGQRVQDTGHLFMHAAPAPNNKFFRASWDMPLPKSLSQPMDAGGRPQAHGEYLKIWNYVLGHIPAEEDRWRRFNNFYINSLRSVDEQLATILKELDALELADRTVVIFTSDHGEMAGSHGLRDKGPFAYEESIHLPFYLVHPDVKGGRDCKSLTAHIDVAPTLLAITGVDAATRSEFANRELPGKDLTPLFTNPGGMDLHAARDAILFTYSGLATVDSGIWKVAADAKSAGTSPVAAVIKKRYVPDLKKRGNLRTAFDGRYKFTRYFSPLDHNKPKTMEELYKWNDVELFDVEADPDEMANLASDQGQNTDVIQNMMVKLDAVIKTEIGIDDGRELPDIPRITWTIDRFS
jgi:arylsulfatase A-like enzyme